MSWDIIFYESASGRKPVKKFIKSLQPPTQAKLANQFDLLEEFGPQLSMPHAKPIGDGLYELRVRGREEVRIFYMYVKVKRIYVLHGFLKKAQIVPRSEIVTAIKRKYEIK